MLFTMDESQSSKRYTCPMHPKVNQDKPGMCPECGMNLVPAKTGSHKKHEMHDRHEGHKTESFFKKFVVSFVLTIPIFLYSELADIVLGLRPPEFTGSEYIGIVLGSVIFFYGGWIFITGSIRELRARLPGMMTLIMLAIVTAFLWSIYATFSESSPLFWELSTLITIMLLGHWIEMKSVKGARGALKELTKLLPDSADVIRNGKTVPVKITDLVKGDIVLVKPGSKIPADGTVIEGQSETDESIVTGESRPVEKKAGDKVIAGSINGDGSLKVRVSEIGESTFLAGVMKLVSEAQASKSRLQILSDKAAFYLTIIAVIAGGATFSAWTFLGESAIFSVTRLVTVLVIACPHALGLAIPLVASISTKMAADSGFIVKQRLALESARDVRTVMFDKTGTLTKGEFGVDDVMPASGYTDNDVLLLAAAVNRNSEHPIAKAIVKEAEKRGLEVYEVQDFQRIPGKGAKGHINGKEVLVGSDALLKETNVNVDLELRIREGRTVVYVISEKKLVGSIALADVIREESKEAISQLKKMGVKVAMITGDSEDVASWVAKELGIEEYFSRVLPDKKSEKVKLLQERGEKVAMVGDGVNDAPALTQADLGIAIGAGTNVAIESAGIILVKNDPRDIPKIIKLSRATYRKMMQNLFWATGYNVIAIPLAAGVLLSRGILLEPAVGAAFMSASTVIVALNALLLRRIKL